ncbi:uncharacterized protein At2g24330-like [Salvia miltiorrhiza]|uniref:uncharacterized protein At2g24330-like n=1 Tax=Salvia miltiorrhiza TaxID=226208 RepID=UPI0025AD5267|nr:uncharacterized protein At2g24330-like [Salvia miltiorrhiza]XP_057769031.1 uncharacterized protein At2g24330-like [Salvia miltiorrhiza]XP_057769032.1 uncharacterized protein At2g24330-like [Salvia miltiorrhiza]XP_057769037.1 uncharacterized protein At2g24330-like [Salvia miltiorrhiza]XP_057769038.1 uncharacterized protein At2g24330-like [Salvia miltiorrhiza]XP_057769040.1 uncharacterized protein At2g24330-like [Salvia miltiorrhiza]XP_057769045.1 uncharacterized protein At2g24330-like [Salv
MAADSKNDVKESTTSTDAEIKTKTMKKKKGLFSRLWGAIFRLHRDDFEKRLQYISKEEAAILSRITRRSNSWRRMTRHLMLFSVLFEAIALGYAIMSTKSLDLDWKMRALRVLPVFLLPALSSITYFTLRSFTRMFDQKDNKTLEKLRAERQAKLDELKEKTNYYSTQQLIQRYDTDPAAKAAAATVLASKLGADSGLKLYMEDVATGKSNDLEVAKTSGLRNRKPSPTNNSPRSASTHHTGEEISNHVGFEGTTMSQQHQMVVEHHQQAGSTQDGGWIARFAALLVGEDPAQSYALICGNCHMHNGLARKEEYSYVTYYCPHCNALNQPKHSERVSGSTTRSTSPTMASSVVEETDVVPNAGGSTGETIAASGSAVAAVDAISGS